MNRILSDPLRSLAAFAVSPPLALKPRFYSSTQRICEWLQTLIVTAAKAAGTFQYPIPGYFPLSPLCIL